MAIYRTTTTKGLDLVYLINMVTPVGYSSWLLQWGQSPLIIHSLTCRLIKVSAERLTVNVYVIHEIDAFAHTFKMTHKLLAERLNS